MFLSYAVLHAGVGHLLGNLGGLAWLGPMVLDRSGARGLLAIWFAAVLGGALAFGLMSVGSAPMVGASGAVFGLAGAWIAHGWRDRRRAGLAAWPALVPVLWAVLVLVAVNVASWIFEAGILAWQTHLGGFVAGAGIALALPARGGAPRVGPGAQRPSLPKIRL